MKVGRLLTSIITLAMGTAGARSIAAFSQFLLVGWLLPEDFGYWAAATSAAAVLVGLLNLGEVNGYLSGQGRGFFDTRTYARRVNCTLMLVGLLAAYGYYWSGATQVATLIALIALTFPMQGEATLLGAAWVKHGNYRAVSVAQVVAALGKVFSGVLLAMWLRSAVSIALSTTIYFAVVCFFLYRVRPGRLAEERVASQPTPSVPVRARIKWAVNSLMLSLPIQAGFLVASFLASPAVLGVYFFSYQVTLGLSGLISEPLSKAVLTALGIEPEAEDREHLAFSLCRVVSAGALLVVGLISAALSVVDVLPSAWILALPVTAILLSSLPVRMMAPIVDGLQQASQKWWQSTTFNAVDMIGTVIATSSIALGDVRLAAVCVTAWKIAFGGARFWGVFRRVAPSGRLIALVPVLLGTVCVSLAAFSSTSKVGLSLIASLLGVVVLAHQMRSKPSKPAVA